MKVPKISVIIPVYNTERYLSACIESVLEQKEQSIEVLAVDNGCTDHSPDILQSYAEKDTRVKVIHITHGEVADARNAALMAAKGEFLAFCDSDDTVPPDAYIDLLRKAEQRRCDVVVAGHCNVQEGISSVTFSMPPKELGLFQMFFYTPCVWNKLIRRSFLEENNLKFPPLIMGEDVLFLAMLLKCSPKTAFLPKPVYYYWKHTAADRPSMTHRYSLEFFQLHLLCRQRLLEEMKGTDYRQEAEKYVYWSMSSFLRTFMLRIWSEEERTAAFELFRAHMMEFDWSECEDEFERITDMTVEEFRSIAAQDYMTQMVNFDHREVVLQEYRNGQIGFRYILHYVAAWFEYKLRRLGANFDEKSDHIWNV